jgi:hypothetical protein
MSNKENVIWSVKQKQPCSLSLRPSNLSWCAPGSFASIRCTRERAKTDRADITFKDRPIQTRKQLLETEFKIIGRILADRQLFLDSHHRQINVFVLPKCFAYSWRSWGCIFERKKIKKTAVSVLTPAFTEVYEVYQARQNSSSLY